MRPFLQGKVELKDMESPIGKNVKVAVIDNGFDHWQSAITENIRLARSYVKESDGVRKPWYTASHAHGTQMASLIRKVNPNCDLYLYRIHSLPSDIEVECALQVCHTFVHF
jgi:hypothetical protein